jgi:hypothetical protein
MPVIGFNIKFSEAERALLAKRAKKEEMTEADYLRLCMLMDAMMAGDPAAVKIFGGKLREKFLARVQRWMGRKELA